MQGWEAYHTCTHTLTPSISPWESTANSALILCHCFLPYVFFCNFPIMLNTVKISTHSHLVLVPSSITCVQLNKRPKPLNECTGWGAQGGERCKNTYVQVPPETSSLHLLSLEQATCHSSDPSPSPHSWTPKQGQCCYFWTWSPQNGYGKSINITLGLCESGRKQATQQTYTNCLTVKFRLQKN